MIGTYDWALLQFRRDGARATLRPLQAGDATEMGYEAPPAA